MTDRDTFAAAALTGLLEPGDVTNSTDWLKAEACRKAYEWADAMLRERERTNHDAAPAAIAVSTDDRTDKAAPSQCRDRPGETPDRPEPIKDDYSDRSYPIGIDPAAYDGDIVSRLRHWRGLHLAHNGELFEAAADEIERLRTVMYRIVDEDCTVAIQNGTFYADGEALFAIPGTGSHACPYVTGTVTRYCTLTPFTLTDAEREAIEKACDLADHADFHSTTRATLRGLLERLK